MTGVLIFVIVLGVLVFVHELGHFWAARKSGIAVEEFGFGFPPRMFGVRRGPTMYSLNWIPFGGFVRMQGEQMDANARPDSFVSVAWYKQLITLLAGVGMNLLFAWVVLTVTFAVGITVDPSTYQPDRYQQRTNPTVQAIVSDGLPAAQSGLRTGAEIISINGATYTSSQALIDYVTDKKYPTLSIVARYQGKESTYDIAPRTVTDTSVTRYGLGLQPTVTVRYPGWIAPWYGLRSTVSLVGQTFVGLGSLANGLVRGQVSQDLTGPIGIAVLTNEVRQFGFISVLQFMALLSISLAALNVLPLPALDGGRAIFVLWSAVTKKPISQKAEAIIHTVGFYALLILVAFISIRDVQRYDLVQQFLRVFRG